MSDFQDSGWQDETVTLPGGGTRRVRHYNHNFLERQDKYDVYYVQFSVPHNTRDFRIYYDQPITSVHSDFWAASELWFEVDGGRELKYRNSKETNEHRESAHFAFDQDGYDVSYNSRRVRFVLRTGTSQGVDSPFVLRADQYT